MNTAELAQVAGETAANLPGFARGYPDTTAWAAYLNGPDGQVLRMDADRRGGRVHVSGIYPESAYPPASAGGPRITVPGRRGGRKIAEEILRQLLPVYVVLLGQVRAHILAGQRDAARRALVAERLTKVLPDVNCHGDGVTWHLPATLGSGGIQLSSDGQAGNVTIHDLPERYLDVFVAAFAAALAADPAATTP